MTLVRAVLALAACLTGGAARADFASVLQAAPITAATSVGFQDSDVTVGTTTPDNVYNFLDTYSFSLDGSYRVSSIAAAIDFRDASGAAVLLGITHLQLNLVETAPAHSVLVSWTAVSMPVSGLEQTVALIPTSALDAGDYLLQVRGYVTRPGSYAGSLIAEAVPPVPLPPACALFACGLLAIGFTSTRLRRD